MIFSDVVNLTAFIIVIFFSFFLYKTSSWDLLQLTLLLKKLSYRNDFESVGRVSSRTKKKYYYKTLKVFLGSSRSAIENGKSYNVFIYSAVMLAIKK